MSDNKIPITDLLSDEDVFESLKNPSKAKPKFDLTVFTLLIIAVLSIIGTVLYFKTALIPIDNTVVITYSSSPSSVLLSNNTASTSSHVKEAKVNINTADKDELCTLYLIGESRALSIISYREANGNFKSIDEIKNVKGIGDAIFENIKDKICI